MALAEVSEAPADHALTKSVLAVERAINALATPSADPREILHHVLATLPSNSQEFLKTDVTTFLRRAPDAQADFKCSNDFVSYKARQELMRLKDTLLNDNPQPAHPQFCYAVPYAVDPTQPMGSIEIYGYDFDREPLQILLLNTHGFREVTFALEQHTHYHLTLDLGTHGVTLSPDDQAIALAWGHLIRHSIPLIQPTTSLCPSRIEEVSGGKEIAYEPLLTDRHRSFRGTRARIVANAALDYESNVVDATLCVTAVERTKYRGAVSGCGVEYVYTSEPDRLIEWVFGELQARTIHTHRDDGSGKRDGARGGPVAQWIFSGFDGSAPARMEPKVRIRLRRIRVVSTKTDGCVSAIVYSEARRVNALGPGSIRRLASQLKRVDPSILKLRPRFAPPSASLTGLAGTTTPVGRDPLDFHGLPS